VLQNQQDMMQNQQDMAQNQQDVMQKQQKLLEGQQLSADVQNAIKALLEGYIRDQEREISTPLEILSMKLTQPRTSWSARRTKCIPRDRKPCSSNPIATATD
jgi:hypothetical protein